MCYRGTYVLDGESVVFRTVPDGEVYRHVLETCAFEVDEIDEFYTAGACWLSVACTC